MSVYRQSEISQTVSLAAPISTTTSMEVRGSDDNFASDRRTFSTEEEIRVNGVVTASNGSSVVGAPLDVFLDGVLRGTVNLAAGNSYMYSIGTLTGEGSHTIRAVFRRYNKVAASFAETSIGPLAISNTTIVVVAAGIVVGVTVLLYYMDRKKRRRR